jgi:cytochrome c oxidase assembly protein subunit 11
MNDSEKDMTNERLPGRERSAGAKKGIWLGGLAAVAIGMFVFAYVNAEFFVMICQEVGLLSKDPNRARSAIVEGEAGRPVDVYFSAHVADNLPIAFSVVDSYQTVNLGRAKINDYTFRNLSDETIYFRPVHDINPLKAGEEGTLVLEKCFCFTEQMLEPGQKYTLPVKYTFTDNLPENVYTIKMAYTLFPSSKEQYEASLKAYAQSGPVEGSH